MHDESRCNFLFLIFDDVGPDFTIGGREGEIVKAADGSSEDSSFGVESSGKIRRHLVVSDGNVTNVLGSGQRR